MSLFQTRGWPDGESHKMKGQQRKFRKYRAVEHIGDAVVMLAARLLVYEIVVPYPFGSVVNKLVSNANLKTAGYESGDAAEIAIGRAFLEMGDVAGIEFAKDLLRKTENYAFLNRSPSNVGEVPTHPLAD